MVGYSPYYVAPEVMNVNKLFHILYMRPEMLDEIMDNFVHSVKESIAVDILPESILDARVGRLLVHIMDRYPRKFVFIIRDHVCFDDIDVLNAVMHIKNLIGLW